MKTEKLSHLIQPLADRHREYLKDESRTSGKAESISFPENEAEIQAIVKALIQNQTSITVQGSRTGITGGAVPAGGHIMNLSKMTKVMGLELDQDGNFAIRVQPGISLAELHAQLDGRRFDCKGWNDDALSALATLKKAEKQFWPPDPSERSASIGGIAANNSRGICAHHYGPAGHHIKSIRVVDANGEVYSLGRHQYLLSHGTCPLPAGNEIRVDPTALRGESPDSLMDLYLGSEGMLGVITELTLSLQSLPDELWGIVFFFEDQFRAVDFIQTIVQRKKIESDTDIVAIEFMDQITLDSIREFKKGNSRLRKLPDVDSGVASAVYMEIHGNNTEEAEAISRWLLAAAIENKSNPDTTWAFCGESEIEPLRLFRHAAPEAVNRLIDKARQIDSRITKLGTDMSLQKESLAEVLEMYRRDLQACGLSAAIFGHAANGHLHVNILPQDYQQFEAGRRLINQWAKSISSKGGSVVTEHGIGKIKKDLFRSNVLPRHLKLMFSIKQQLDPNGLWNPGNMPDANGQTK